MTRHVPALIAACFAGMVLVACETAAPYSNVIDTTGDGVGFSDYTQYRRAQEELARIRRADAAQAAQRSAQGQGSALAAQPADAPRSVAQDAVAALRGRDSGGIGAPEASSTLTPSPMPGQLSADMDAPTTGSEPLSAMGSAAPAQGGGVSDQRFEPGSFADGGGAQLPQRDTVPQVQVADAELGTAGGPNLFAYAISTTHQVGTQRYTRSHPLRWRRWEAACRQFTSQDLAQEAFLAAGGPEQDPNHLDPDGDGFACWWDPAPFREAARTVRARE